jgi:hypothetical protein
MPPIKRTGFVLLAVILLWGTACRKYAEGPAAVSSSPAYLRVFNIAPLTATVLNSAAPAPFFTFIMDPKTDAAGVTNGGSIVGDWLGQRQEYVSSVSINEGNSLGASLDTFVTHNITYEYPGSAHVLTAPPIHGYDLSAWAQVPSGKHRVLFIARPQTDSPFVSLSPAIRKSILIDTTIDLQAGKVYTLEAVATDEDHNKFGAYLRQEQFVDQTFSDSNIYVGFYNLSGIPSAYSANNAYSGSAPYPNDFPDSMVISCTYSIFDWLTYNASLLTTNTAYAYDPLQGFNNIYLTTLTQRMNTTTQFLPLPLLPSSYYYDDQGIFGSYTPGPRSPVNNGSLPFVTFGVSSLNTALNPNTYEIICNNDPATINNFDPSFLVFSEGYQRLAYWTASLSYFTNVNGVITARPSLIIIEIAYGYVYMMRIQQAAY